MASDQRTAAERFAEAILSRCMGSAWGDLDGLYVEEMAVASGLMERVVVEEPCRPDCHCARESLDGDWPLECTRLTAAGKALRIEAQP